MFAYILHVPFTRAQTILMQLNSHCLIATKCTKGFYPVVRFVTQYNHLSFPFLVIGLSISSFDEHIVAKEEAYELF